MQTSLPVKQLGQLIVAAGLIGWGASVPGAPATFEEVSSLVRSNLAGATPGQLDQLAVEGLLNELAPRVMLVEDPADSFGMDQPPGVVATRLYRDSVGYVRLGGIVEGTEGQLRARYRDMVTSNRLSGFVLDLRRATGDDYAAALEVADQFLMNEVPLINWGEGLRSSGAKEDAIMLPIAVLVNRETGGAAEALAGMLRQSGVALLIGTHTAGTAGVQQSFPLTNGQYLRITVANIQLGDARMLGSDGLVPDVKVVVDPRVEASVLDGEEHPEGDGMALESETNDFPTRLRMNEADLVRRWKGEMLSDEDLRASGVEKGPEARDAALLRALDLMDGLAILRSWQK